MSTTSDARALLMKSTKTSELMREVNRHRPVVSLAHNITLAEALHVLTENKILSAPVIVLADALDVRLPDEDANAEPMETLIGFFDVRDAVTAILRNMNFSKDSLTSCSKSCLWWLREIELIERRIGNTPLMQCLGYDADFMYTPNASVTSVYDLVKKGFFGKSRDDVVHRVVLFDASGALHRLISQTDVVEWLAEHDGKLSHSLETKSLRELGFGSDERRRQFVTVKATTPTIACFQQMMDKNVSGAAIVEEERVIADITFGDLRLLTPEYFSVLGLPVAEFIALTHNTSYAGFALTSTNTPETFQKSAFFEKSRTFKSEQTEKVKKTRAIDPRRRDLYGAGDAEPTGVLTVSLESLFQYAWFTNKLYKQRVYVVAQNDTVVFDVITLTDVLECATCGGAHKGPHRCRR